MNLHDLQAKTSTITAPTATASMIADDRSPDVTAAAHSHNITAAGDTTRAGAAPPVTLTATTKTAPLSRTTACHKTAAPQTASGVPGITVLEGRAARLQQVFAAGVLLVPTLGMVEAVRLALQTPVPLWAYGAFVVMYFVHMFGVTAGLHRLASHRGYEAPDWLKIVLTAMGSTAAQGPLLYWVSTHRRHHTYSDREGDPHSPNLHESRWYGLWYSHMPWMLSRSVSTWTHYANDVLRDRALFFVHRTYLYWVVLGLALPAALGAVLNGWYGAWVGFIFGGLARMFCANQSAWMVGSLSHRYGGRKFATDDHSRNNWLVAVLAFGEGLQNNHHAFPVNYRHSIDWYEPDLTGWILALMGKLGLVRNLKFPSAEKVKQLRLTERSKDSVTP